MMPKTALAFSGGKDSWACLWLYKKQLPDIQVVWIDTGKNYPEILETIEKAKVICPNFVSVKVDRDGQNAYNGVPSDIVPINWTVAGCLVGEDKPNKIQSYLQCCYDNIAYNLYEYCKRHGITSLICGQRNDERHKSTARNGDIIEGIARIQPIEKWTETQVLDFVGSHMALPPHFSFKHSSMDCYDCTAYTKETRDIQEYRRVNFPEFEAIYLKRKNVITTALKEAI